MKKILFVCDGDHYPQGAYHFIKAMNQQERILVKGFFFTPIDFEQLIPVSYIPIAQPFVRLKEEENALVSKSKQKLTRQCEADHIKYEVHEKSGEWNKGEFIRETRFADLVVISEELFCFDVGGDQPNYFMEELLHNAECPVLVIPEGYRNVERLVVAYDGKTESMFALKQFTYLFPQFTDLPAEFVFAKDEPIDRIPDASLLQEFVSLHFGSLATTKLHFDAKEYFGGWMKSKENALLVTGSFGRSAVSNMLKDSFSAEVIRQHQAPLFIAHHV